MANKINTIAYVFSNQQAELKRLVVKYGLQPAKSESDLWRKVNFLVLKFPVEFLKDIALIHPDRELILSTGVTPIVKTDVVKTEEKKSSCSGCEDLKSSGCDGKDGKCNCGCDKKSSANGDDEGAKPDAAVIKPIKDEATGLVALVPMILLGLLVGGITIYAIQNVKA